MLQYGYYSHFPLCCLALPTRGARGTPQPCPSSGRGGGRAGGSRACCRGHSDTESRVTRAPSAHLCPAPRPPSELNSGGS